MSPRNRVSHRYWQTPLVQVSPFGQSCGWKHCAHVPVWQTGRPTGQSVFERQTTHWPSGSQSFPGCAVQSVLARHCTQLEEDVSHRGASPEHVAFDVHPGRHWN